MVYRRRLEPSSLSDNNDPSPGIGAFDPCPEKKDNWIENSIAFVTFARVQNITGQPAVSVPLYINDNNLPIGVQFAGRTGSEDLLLWFSAGLEKARPWSRLRKDGIK